MKYIRTDDGRILEFNKLNEVSKLSIDMGEEPIREADTIENLCDEFVFVLNHNKIGKENEYIMIKKSNLEYFKLLVKDIKNSALYGAIWTDKGLIYVAKMNDKGELELI